MTQVTGEPTGQTPKRRTLGDWAAGLSAILVLVAIAAVAVALVVALIWTMVGDPTIRKLLGAIVVIGFFGLVAAKIRASPKA